MIIFDPSIIYLFLWEPNFSYTRAYKKNIPTREVQWKKETPKEKNGT